MCYYATIDYLCGDWKWGNMMLQCPRQHRIGETCGAKLVHHESVTKSATICKICEEIGTKQRRLSRTHDSISRWSKEGDKFSASLEKARREGRELEEKIRELHLRRPSIATTIAGGTRSSGSARTGSTTLAAPTTLPPVTSMSTSATPEYEYVSAPPMSRRQENGTCDVPRNGVMPALGPAPMASQYTNLSTASYMSRTSATVPTANVPSGGHSVSYARR